MVTSALVPEAVMSPAPCIHNNTQQMRAISPGTEVHDILQDLGEDGRGQEKGDQEPGSTAAAAVTGEHRAADQLSPRGLLDWEKRIT